jgi:hypothetical protein
MQRAPSSVKTRGLSLKPFLGLPTILRVATLAFALMAAYPAKATDFTLSKSGILSLDDNMSNLVSQTSSETFTTTILSNQDIPGTGVVFTIHFPGTNLMDSLLFWTSNSTHGNGTLAGLVVSAYTNFVLKFTVLSIDGSSNATESLEMGTVIGPFDSSPYAYHPDVASLTGDFPPSVVSTISVTSATITDIGFIVDEFPPGSWSEGPHDVTILVQPADGALQLPEIPVPSCALSVTPATNNFNQLETVVATVTTNGNAAPGVPIDVFVTAGPNIGDHVTTTTDARGLGTFTYTGTGGTGTDSISVTGTVNSLAFTGTTTAVWINTNSSPALTYDLERQSHGKCHIGIRIDTNLNVVTTNSVEICKSYSFNLTVTNTGQTNTPPFRVRAWAEQDSIFNPNEPVHPQVFRVKPLKNNQIDTIRFRGQRYSNSPFIYITDTNNNVLTAIEIE